MAKEIVNVNGMSQKSIQKTTLRNINEISKKEQKNAEEISTGKKINSSSDDLAGFALAEQIHAQIQGLDMASKNSQDGISMVQTADGALGEVNDMLTRARELTIQAGNGALSENERNIIKNELNQLGEGIADIANNTEFNEKKLLDGSSKNATLQVGANEGQTTEVDFSTDFNEIAEKIKNIDLSSGDIASQLNSIDESIDQVNSVRSEYGATVNALGSTASSLDVSSVNLSNAKSVITDSDMAKSFAENIRLAFRRDTVTTMVAQSEALLGGLGSVLN
ncbi:MAG: flagellin [Lachnospirales bacterium]